MPTYIAEDTRGVYLYYWLEKGGRPFKTIRFWQNLKKQEKCGIKIYKLENFLKKNGEQNL
jgi:hypothetical protein